MHGASCGVQAAFRVNLNVHVREANKRHLNPLSGTTGGVVSAACAPERHAQFSVLEKS